MLETQDYTETLGKALENASPEEVAKEVDDGLIHLSTGVILEPRKVSPFIFQDVANNFQNPPVPKFFNDNKGREEENPMHPGYLAAVSKVEQDRAMAMIDATIALGTKVVSIPQGFALPDEEDWLDDLEIVGITINRDNRRLRYRTWIKYIAAPSVSDVELIMSKVLSAIGVPEEEVAKATASFQHKA